MVGDAALTGSRFLRPASGSSDRGGFRRLCRGDLRAVLRATEWGAIGSAGAVFPDAHGGLFRGDRFRTGDRVACSDSLSLRAFLRLETSERVPDHSWLSRTRGRLPHEVHDRVFGWVLSLLAEHGLVRGARIGVDASTMEANAALLVRRDTGEDYRAMLTRMARESGIETPSAEDLVRLDRKRKGRKLSNQAWVSETDPQARVAKMKNGTTHLAYKPEHAVDLDTGAVAAAELHPADKGDTRTIEGTLASAKSHLSDAGGQPSSDAPAECVADKGYHSRAVLKGLDGGPWTSRIAEPRRAAFSRWHGDEEARRAVYNIAPVCNRASAKRPCASGPRSSSGPSPTS